MTSPHASDGESAPVAPEFLVGDVAAAARFYRDVFGFDVVRDEGTFALLRRGDAVIMFDERQNATSEALDRRLNIRIMVENVDAVYARVQQHGVTIVARLDDRDYGLRDFTCLDLNGFALRFAAPVR